MEKGKEKKQKERWKKKSISIYKRGDNRNSGSFLKIIVFWPLRQTTKTRKES